MQYFTQEYLDFFKDLSNNNNKEWFHDNKKRYENNVKKPFLNFVIALIEEVSKIDNDINQDAKKCISRINRDIRFSKDKTPYNLHLNAHITKGDPKNNPFPIIAIRFGGFEAGIMSGHFMPSKERLISIRNQIKDNTKTFSKLYSDKRFVESFGKIEGEANKRIPVEFQETFETEPLIANKQFYYMSEQKPDFITKNDLMSTIMKHWEFAKPLNEFITKAIKP